VAWRSSFKGQPQVRGLGAVRAPARARVAAIVALVAAGCGRNAVRASEKEHLSNQVMIFDDDRQEAAADEHVLTNREGSAGGRGSKGGGCGCN
jgi:hypothetical protein